MSQYLIFIALIPILCFQLTKLFKTKDKWFYRGLSIGLVIAPLSYGLLQFTYIPVIGKLIGVMGLLVNLTHGTAGYFCLAGSGLLEPGVILSVSELTLIHLINGIIFASAYGMIGYSIDRKMEIENARPVLHQRIF